MQIFLRIEKVCGSSHFPYARTAHPPEDFVIQGRLSYNDKKSLPEPFLHVTQLIKKGSGRLFYQP